jgi:DNA-binding NarL/FixJ family response regulator
LRAGVVAALASSGHFVEHPDDLLEWLNAGESSVVVLTLESERDWSVLAAIATQRKGSAVIALLVDGHPATGVRAVRAGARSVLPRNTSPEMLLTAIDAAVRGISVLPADVLGNLRSSQSAPEPPMPALTAEQLSWLRGLAAGVTVSDLADRAGYSERAMYRLLQRLYEQLGAHGRTQALMRAHTMGWLDAPD